MFNLYMILNIGFEDPVHKTFLFAQAHSSPYFLVNICDRVSIVIITEVATLTGNFLLINMAQAFHWQAYISSDRYKHFARSFRFSLYMSKVYQIYNAESAGLRHENINYDVISVGLDDDVRYTNDICVLSEIGICIWQWQDEMSCNKMACDVKKVTCPVIRWHDL